MTAAAIRRAIAARLGQAAATAFVLATLCFAFVHALPGDLALRIAGGRLGEDPALFDSIERIRREEGLDRPIAVQYGAWMARLATADLGNSLISRRPVWDEIMDHAGYTMTLGAIGWLLSYLIALPIGIAAGLRAGGWLDRVTGTAAVALASLPNFLIGIGLISLFALTLRWLPPAGYRTGAHMVLPALTLALGFAAFSVRIIRNAVADMKAAFFMTYARIKGLSAGGAFRHHGARNAAVPVVTYAALQFAFVIDGFVIIETLFNYPGIGDLLIKSLLARDIPVVMGAGLFIGFLFALVNLVADIVCLWLDPRARAPS